MKFLACCRLHEFQWHGSDRNDPGRYIPGKNKFKQLRHVPSHLYCTVRDVRTNDISIITVKLMVFFQLADVERMVRAKRGREGEGYGWLKLGAV